MVQSLLSHERGQSAVIGVLLLTGIMVILVTVVGTASVTNFVATSTDDSPTFNCRIAYADGNVTVAHAGGDAVPTASLEAVVRNDSGQARRTFDADGGVGERFTTGEVVRLGSLNTTSEVLVTTDRAVACQETVVVD